MTHAMLEKLRQQLEVREQSGLRRRHQIVDTPCSPHMTVEGRPLLAFCSNDYLGLAAHPQVKQALCEGVNLYGVGSGGSHLISGHSRAHANLEAYLAEWMSPYLESARALYFCTGYMANLAIVTALASMGSAEIFSEEANHASLIDGTRLSRTPFHIYPHNDLAALGVLLEQSTTSVKIVVTDSVFSMDGDYAPLPELLALCIKYDAWLVVDDAHGFGVLGAQGRGALEHFSIRSDRLIYMGTLGKAAGVGGAFVAAHETIIEWITQKARPYIYTTAAPPALAHALLASLRLIGGEEGALRRQHLHQLIQLFKDTLALTRWWQLPSETAIQPIIIGSNHDVVTIAHALQAQGLWVSAIRPPTVPEHMARLRITLSASHTRDDVCRLAKTLNDIESKGWDA